ncbi:hypothetical protein AVEN_112601-1 [Araneus ventricosus]|uniref:Alpha-latrotoxin n=1 Tax=Araneus ventricosus TaxID=182803 RepID=A0A4Y2MHM2_ARAVE|nr:hypothetical protein AVEN_112601-1 [Araneus ventricosus]
MSMRLTELHLAISFKNLNHIKYLMRDGLVLDRMWRGEMPVSRALYYEAYEILEYLVQIGAEVNVRSQDDRMEPPLFAACRLRRLRAVHILLQSPNLNIDQRDFFNRTPLWAAVRSSSLEMVELLLDHGADVTAVQDFTACPLLLSMLSLGRKPHCKIPSLLIKRGCLLDFKSPEGSALFFSVIFEKRNLFCLLVRAGCSIENEEWLSMDKLPLSWKNDENFCQWICTLHNNPHSLVHLTSCVIRKSLVKLHKNIFPPHIAQLLLPEALQRCLLLED